MKELSAQFRIDGKNVAIRWSSPGPSAQEIEQLIQGLAQLREGMQPAVAMQAPAPGASTHTISDPELALGTGMSGRLLIGARHPGMGWLTLALGSDAATTLQQQIAKLQAEEGAPKPRH